MWSVVVCGDLWWSVVFRLARNQRTFDDHILSSEKCQRDCYNLVIYVIRTHAYINSSSDNLRTLMDYIWNQ